MFFLFPVTFFGLPVTLFEKVPVILKKCPWQKTPNFARENWLVARDKKAKKMPVKNEKWPWQFLQICKSARDNFWFLPVIKQKVPVTNQLFFLRNFKSPVKVTGFFFREKFIGHSFIRNPEILLFCRTKGGKREVLFCLPLFSPQQLRISQNYLEYKAFLFSKLEFDYVLAFDWY